MANTAERIDARPGYHLRLFEKTGLVMTADVSRNDRITLESVSVPSNSMDGATTNDADVDFEGDSWSKDDDDPDSDDDINCVSNDNSATSSATRTTREAMVKRP